MSQEGKQGGGTTVLLWLFLLSTIPSTFPNWPYCSLMQERASPCAVWLTGGDRLCLGFFTPTLVLVLGCFALFCFPLFLLRTAVGCVLCVLYVTDTVLLGHLSCWDSQLPPPTPLIPSDLAWQRQEVQKKGQFCSGKVRAQSRGGKVAYRDFQLLNQNSKCECFCLSCTRPGLLPQP